MNRLLILCTLLILACSCRKLDSDDRENVIRLYSKHDIKKYPVGSLVVVKKGTYEITLWEHGGNVLCRDEEEKYDGHWHIASLAKGTEKDTSYSYHDKGETTCDGDGGGFEGYREVMFFTERRKGTVVDKNWVRLF